MVKHCPAEISGKVMVPTAVSSHLGPHKTPPGFLNGINAFCFYQNLIICSEIIRII